MNIGILPNVEFFKTESGCKAGDKCMFPHYKVEEQPSKKPNKSFNFQNGKKRRHGCCSSCERYHSWVVSRKTPSRQNFRKE